MGGSWIRAGCRGIREQASRLRGEEGPGGEQGEHYSAAEPAHLVLAMECTKQFRLTVATYLAVAALQSAQGYEWPALAYEATEHPLSLPTSWYLGEVAGVDLDSQGHLFVFHRGEHQLLEFDADGKFVREIGQGLFRVPHGLRIDDKDNIWTTDQETHQVIKFDHGGKVALVLGRRNIPGRGWYDRGYDLVSC